MKSLNHLHVFALAAVLLAVTGLIAKEPPKKERFVPENSWANTRSTTTQVEAIRRWAEKLQSMDFGLSPARRQW